MITVEADATDAKQVEAAFKKIRESVGDPEVWSSEMRGEEREEKSERSGRKRREERRINICLGASVQRIGMASSSLPWTYIRSLCRLFQGMLLFFYTSSIPFISLYLFLCLPLAPLLLFILVMIFRYPHWARSWLHNKLFLVWSRTRKELFYSLVLFSLLPSSSLSLLCSLPFIHTHL